MVGYRAALPDRGWRSPPPKDCPTIACHLCRISAGMISNGVELVGCLVCVDISRVADTIPLQGGYLDDEATPAIDEGAQLA